MEGLVDENDLCMRPFVIKNTKNGKYNTYKHSYFHPKMVEDEVLEAFDDEDIVCEPYDLTTIDVVPEETSAEEVGKWLEGAIKKYNEANGTDDDEEGKEPPKKSKGGIQDRLKSKKAAATGPDEDEQESDQEDDGDEGKEEDQKPKSGSSLRDRLKNARK